MLILKPRESNYVDFNCILGQSVHSVWDIISMQDIWDIISMIKLHSSALCSWHPQELEIYWVLFNSNRFRYWQLDSIFIRQLFRNQLFHGQRCSSPIPTPLFFLHIPSTPPKKKKERKKVHHFTTSIKSLWKWTQAENSETARWF